MKLVAFYVGLFDSICCFVCLFVCMGAYFHVFVWFICILVFELLICSVFLSLFVNFVFIVKLTCLDVEVFSLYLFVSLAK